MTTVLAATLAQRAGARELVLFHLSDRYQRQEWVEMLCEARLIFRNTHYPPQWSLEAAGGAGAAPRNGGPATPSGNAGVTEGRTPVS